MMLAAALKDTHVDECSPSLSLLIGVIIHDAASGDLNRLA
jgi:hypothetical protein